VLSDCHLDDARVLEAIDSLLSTYASVNFTDPADKRGYPTFVFCGNFSSQPFLYDGPSMARYQREHGRNDRERG
jgi:hypothetical protein